MQQLYAVLTACEWEHQWIQCHAGYTHPLGQCPYSWGLLLGQLQAPLQGFVSRALTYCGTYIDDRDTDRLDLAWHFRSVGVNVQRLL